jgi:hypothetical protein
MNMLWAIGRWDSSPASLIPTWGGSKRIINLSFSEIYG